MTFERIKQLIEYLPNNSTYFRDVLNYTPQVNAVNKFLCAYKDLSFGYHCIKAFIKDKKQLPIGINEPILYNTYMFERYGNFNENVVFALSLIHPSNKMMEDSIKAFLITDASFEEISKMTGISAEVLRYYEQLFFNIRDRKKEALFIASIVYPDTRLVELNDNYLKNEDKGKLLIRAAYNNGLNDAAYFSGLNADTILSSGAPALTMATKLESLIMANGYFLAKNFPNSKAAGISQARNILIAAKQGGQDSANVDDAGIGSLGDMAMGALLEIKHDEIEAKAEAIAKLTVEQTQGMDVKQLEDANPNNK